MRRNQREKRVDEERRPLDGLELQDKSADKAAATRLETARVAYKLANKDLHELLHVFQFELHSKFYESKSDASHAHHQRHAAGKTNSK